MYIILFYICLGIFIVLCLTIFFSYRQYANIRNLFATLSGEGSAPDKGQNEYEALRCILKNLSLIHIYQTCEYTLYSSHNYYYVYYEYGKYSDSWL